MLDRLHRGDGAAVGRLPDELLRHRVHRKPHRGERHRLGFISVLAGGSMLCLSCAESLRRGVVTDVPWSCTGHL